MISLLLFVIALAAVLGWWRAMVHWQRALDRERLLLELVRKLIQYLPSIVEDLHNPTTHETRH
jgi:hypothetical protein